jgi:CBS domain containing-hemolysin-like protein
MKPIPICRPASHRGLGLLLFTALLAATPAHASMFQGETLDKVAGALAWIVLILAPIIGIGVFLLIHILPEKIAEKKQHPQAAAIQCLCLLSLVFGGLLWPLAWLWAYSKPVMYKLAYGTDKVPHGHDEPAPAGAPEAGDNVLKLRQRVAELENQLARQSGGAGNKG